MSMEMNKALDLLRGLVSEVERKTCCHEETHRGGAIWEICDSCGAKWADDEGGKPEFAWPESVEKARAFLATHPAVEQAGGDERVIDGKPRATKCPDCGEGDLMPGDLCACGYETDPAAGYACSECDGSGEGCVGEVCRECGGSGWFVTPEQARAALAQPSPMPPDRGPWHAVKWDGGRRVDLSSDDFEHDVALTVSGDFVEGDKFRYAQELAAWMNAHLAQPSPARADEKPGDSILCYGCFAKGVGPDHFDEAGKCLVRQQTEPLGAEFAQVLSDNLPELLSTAQAEKAEGFTRFPELMESVQQMDAMLKANSAQAERPEVVAYRTIGRHTKHQHPHYALNYYKQNAEDQAAHWRERGCEVSDDELMTVAQHDRIVGPLRYKAELYDEVWALVTGKGYMNVTTAISVLESERDAALAEVAGLRSLLNSLLCYVERDIDRMRSDRDKSDNKEIYDRSISLAMERLKAAQNAVFTTEPGCDTAVELAAQTTQAQHSVPEEFSFEYRHPNGESHTVTVSRDQVINEMPDFLFEALCSKFCNCEPVGETNVVECCCDEYAEEFKLLAAAPGKEGL